MEALAQDLPIAELIARTDALMVKLGYTAFTMRHFRQAWNALKNQAKARGETVLTTELGFTLLREHYHIDPYTPHLDDYKRVVRRAVMLLLEYQVSGGIAKRLPRREHSFPNAYEEVGDRYLDHLSLEKHLTNGSIRNHRLALEAAFAFFVSHGVPHISDVDIHIINTYLKTFAGCSKSYISGRVNGLKRFFEYALREGYTQKTFSFPKVSVYKDRKVPEYYSAGEIKLMLDAIDRANPRGKRDYAMMLIGARYGLRISDIKALELKHIDFVNNKISITQIKTGKPLALDLLPDVGWAIIDYVKNGRPQSESPKIFIRHVVPYTSFKETDNLAHIIARYATAAGAKTKVSEKSSFHMLRYGLASTLLRQNVPLTTISGILGHSELNVTTTYTKIDVSQLLVCALEVPQ